MTEYSKPRSSSLSHASSTALGKSLLLGLPLVCLTACLPPRGLDESSSNGAGSSGDCDCAEGGTEDTRDRSQTCELEENIENGCGYPAPKGEEYGYEQGDRIPNFILKDCQGEDVEFAEFLQDRPDNNLPNKGIIFALGASWCGPCAQEGKHFAEIAEENRPRQIEFLQVLHEGAPQSMATNQDCQAWLDGVADNKFTILYDPDNQIDNLIIPPEFVGAIPWVLGIDANANIRSKTGGGQPISDEALEQLMQDLIDSPFG